jgi:hypothetical protein
MNEGIKIITPGSFIAENHFYEKALNSQIHPLVEFFFNLGHERLIERYSHLNPAVNKQRLQELLSYRPTSIFWGGADLFYVTTRRGERKMVVIETNSCPSGQKSMPSVNDIDEFRGYRRLIEDSFLPLVREKCTIQGKLAVIYDKNYMEVSGYAATMAELSGEDVYLVPFLQDEKDENGEKIERPHYAFFEDGILYVNDPTQGRVPIRAALRYVTQRPWNRIPIQTKTLIYNPIIACLAGGRNKLIANKAYEFFNAELGRSGLKILYPETINDVSKNEVPLWVKKFGGFAVVKIPYSNAGQGVYTITSKEELDAFMKLDHSYSQFIVQSLIGHFDWTSILMDKKYYHIGTVPNKLNKSFVSDLRMMVHSTQDGIFPVAIYARKTRKPLLSTPPAVGESWSVLGTNLSIKLGEDQWDSDKKRLALMDRKDFNILGLGLDDLIQGFIQTTMSLIAIDKMAEKLISSKGQLKKKLFQSLDNDLDLIKEIIGD